MLAPNFHIVKHKYAFIFCLVFISLSINAQPTSLESIDIELAKIQADTTKLDSFENRLESFGEKSKGVSLEVDMSPVELDVDVTVHIGLITNELMTNSLKYTFKENQGAKISISMKKEKGNMVQLKIPDKGTYINPSENEKGGTGFGAMLVQLLTTQLEGKLEQITKDGTATILRFPLNIKQVA